MIVHKVTCPLFTGTYLYNRSNGLIVVVNADFSTITFSPNFQCYSK